MNKELKKLMKENNFFLLRQKKHLVWKHISGGIVTTAKTPSCHRAFKNIVREIEAVTLMANGQRI